MFIRLTKSQMIDCLKDGFSYSAAEALIDYLEEMEKGTGTEIEFDPICLKVEFTEYESASEAVYDIFGLNRCNEKAVEILSEHTTVIEFENGCIVEYF